MIRPLRIVGAVLWVFFFSVRWVKLQVNPLIEWFTESILGGWEEGTKSFVRETFTNTTRVVNGFFSWCLAFLDRKQYDSFKSRWGRSHAWQEWWHEGRQSTLNAFIATHTPSTPANKKQRLNLKQPSPVKLPQRPWWQQQLAGRWAGVKRWMRGFFNASSPSKLGRRSHLIRSGSDLFDRPSGYAVESSKRGLVEDVRMWIELGVTRFFDAVRKTIRTIFFLPPKAASTRLSKMSRINTAPSPSDSETWEEVMTRPRAARFRRRRSLSSWEGSLSQTTAADAIHAAGYPLQIHTVTTPDGYVIQMERIPRPGVRDVVFFMHGILDTSMGWVANGTGSHAFAAYDQGMDVWLGNSRSNPPRTHVDPSKHHTPKYWQFSVNELGMEDCLAQIDHIHFVKCQELHANAGPPPAGLDRPQAVVTETSPIAGSLKGLRRAASDSAVVVDRVAPLGLDDFPAPSLRQRFSQDQNQKRATASPPPTRQPRLRPTQSARRSHEDLAAMANGKSHSLANGSHSNGGSVPVPQAQEPGSPPVRQRRSFWSAARSGSSPGPPSDDASPSEGSGELDSPRQSESVGHSKATSSPPNAETLSPDRAAYEGIEMQPEEDIPARGGSRQNGRFDGGPSHEGPPDPYRLRAVGHSLGGAALLIYAVMSRRKGRRHHIYRLILLTPAGFQRPAPKVALPFIWFLPLLTKALSWLRPGDGAAVLIPTPWLRYITFKLTADLQAVPALQELTRAGIRLLMNGDTSQWDRAMQMPHYNPTSMPAISLHTGMHLVQWVRSGRFRLYDYGSSAANQRHYNEPEPCDVAEHYGLLDCPVDIMAGRADGVIAPQNVLQHYDRMRAAGAAVTYKEFNFGHLDFTFALKEELVYYVRSRLRMRHDSRQQPGISGPVF